MGRQTPVTPGLKESHFVSDHDAGQVGTRLEQGVSSDAAPATVESLASSRKSSTLSRGSLSTTTVRFKLCCRLAGEAT